MAWTNEQQEAITSRNGNLLVSAAAGSGKTAVLVERIIERVLDKTAPIDIDTIVVVTFTKAAAEEMKIRLNNAFYKALEENPGDRHLLRQLSLIDNARITTIDSFCMYILKNYYNLIELDPAFTVGDPGEMNLLMGDIIERILEKHFTEKDDDFYNFVEAFAPGKSIDKMGEYILQLYKFSQSYPWPEKWLTECNNVYNVNSIDEYNEIGAIKDAVLYIKMTCSDYVKRYDKLIDLCNETGAPSGYKANFECDRDMLLRASMAEDINTLRIVLGTKFVTLSRAEKECDKVLKDVLKAERDSIKKKIGEIYSKYLAFDIDTMFEDMRRCKPYVRVLTDLAIEFTNVYSEVKRDKKLVDFSDIEHLVLNILIESHDAGEIKFSATADELAERINEIYVDEYQDSNLVQELILSAVSKERFGSPDMFMVGDVKQSIYKFRMARPELFMKKYEEYLDEGPYKKIELHNNFRSRPNVLNCINDIFFQIMKKTIGGIEYTDAIKLNPGLEFEEDAFDDRTEILIADKNEFKDSAFSNTEIDANICAKRIKELVQDGQLAYRDIAILLRSDKVDGPVYSSVLNSHGIPCIYASTTGYFDAMEIKTVMNYLAVIDNERQEIPLAAIMNSFFFDFSIEETAIIKGNKRHTELIDCIKGYTKKGDLLAIKCQNLLKSVNDLREKSKVMSISELISDIIYNSGYSDYINLMPSGSVARANLDMLVEKASDYEKTSYVGLFNFLRYVDKLIKYETDYGDSQVLSEEDDVVRVMSIHKSKGLEFPVVFIGNMGKKYNTKSTSETIIFDSDYGIGLDYIDTNMRIKMPVCYRSCVAGKMYNENIGEELRILYVAMTRAMKKLIMVGTSTASELAKWCGINKLGFDNSYIIENKTYLGLVMPCINSCCNKGRFLVKQMDIEQIDEFSKEIEVEDVISANERLKGIMNHPADKSKVEQIETYLNYSYPYPYASSLKAKYAVSDLKHKAIEESEVLEARLVTPDRVKPVPRFAGITEEVTGSERGNAYHKAFELLDYNTVKDITSMKNFIDTIVASGRISEEYRALIDCNKYVIFLNTELGQNMKKAAIEGNLYREQPFIMEVSASEVDTSYPETEKVIVQGIIDAFYLEGDKIVVIDYKTDRADESIIVSRYKKQLELYCEALKKITGKERCECYIYSVYLDKSIDLQYS